MLEKIEIPLSALTESFVLPQVANSGDAGFDLRASVTADIKPLERALIPCGFAMEIPAGYAGLVIPRSGLAIKHGITVLNAPGLIDSGYRGEIGVVLYNSDNAATFSIAKGDRIAQLVIISLPKISFKETKTLGRSERGTAGFGSSGIQ